MCRLLDQRDFTKCPKTWKGQGFLIERVISKGHGCICTPAYISPPLTHPIIAGNLVVPPSLSLGWFIVSHLTWFWPIGLSSPLLMRPSLKWVKKGIGGESDGIVRLIHASCTSPKGFKHNPEDEHKLLIWTGVRRMSLNSWVYRPTCGGDRSSG